MVRQQLKSGISWRFYRVHVFFCSQRDQGCMGDIQPSGLTVPSQTPGRPK